MTPPEALAFTSQADVAMSINGVEVTSRVPVDRRLAAFIREDIGLTGTKLGCEVGVCGVCTVLVDSVPTSSCSLLAVQAHGTEVKTVEGLAADPRGKRLQEAFIAEGGFQCGFCTSGQLMAAWALLTEEASITEGTPPSDEAVPPRLPDDVAHHLMGNLCRCTGYYGIMRAVEEASR